MDDFVCGFMIKEREIGFIGLGRMGSKAVVGHLSRHKILEAICSDSIFEDARSRNYYCYSRSRRSFLALIVESLEW